MRAGRARKAEARRNVGILFDDNRLNDETARLMKKLADQQLCRRRVALVPRRPAQRLHHALHHHRLRPPAAPGREARYGAGLQIARPARRLDRPDLPRDPRHGHKDEDHLDSTIALYLYGRIVLPGRQADRRRSTARRSITSSARPRSTGSSSIAGSRKAIWPLALKRFGDKPTATDIMKSLKERSVTNEELGMFWRDTGAFVLRGIAPRSKRRP